MSHVVVRDAVGFAAVVAERRAGAPAVARLPAQPGLEPGDADVGLGPLEGPYNGQAARTSSVSPSTVPLRLSLGAVSPLADAAKPVFRIARLDDPDSAHLLADYEAELAGQGIVLQRGEGGGVGPEEMVAPHGVFLLVELGRETVACGGIRRLSGDIAEVKRMYVAPAARGRGVGRALLARLEDEARLLGCRLARLDTGRGMVAALSLYRAAGYREIPDYNGNPHAGHWMEKSLSG